MGLDRGEIIIEHPSPARQGWVDPNPQKAQAGFAQNRAGDTEGHADDNRGQRIGQQVAADDALVGDADADRGQDVVLFTQGQELPPDQTGDAHPTGHNKDKQDIAEAGP